MRTMGEHQHDEIARLRAELKLMEHKVITCGVAATNPDAGLTLRDDYMQWNSPQADAVRALRAERDSLRAELEALRGRTGCCAECERLTLSVDPNQSEPV